MKIKEFVKKLIAVTFAATLIMSVGFSAFAVDEEGNDPAVVIDDGDTPEYSEPDQGEEEPQVSTDADIESDPVEEPDENVETTPDGDEEEDYDPVPETHAEPATSAVVEDDEEDEADDADDAEYDYVEPEPVATQKAVQNTGRAADESKIPTSFSDPQGEDGDLTYGYVSWACVIVGIIAVLIVLVSNKTRYYGGDGKHRYGEGNRITGQQKHLLDEDYYKTRKYNSYYSKDTRK